MKRVLLKFLGGTFLAGALWFCLPSNPQTGISVPPAMGQQQPSLLARIIVDEKLWDKDAPAAFAWLDSWRQIDEREIVIHSDSVTAGIASVSTTVARQRAARLDAATKGQQPKLKPFFAERFAGRLPATPPFNGAFLTSQEDDSIRVAWLGKTLRILKKGVTMSMVFNTYGRPERTTTRSVQNRRDGRPILLTFHHYANGTVQFVERDPAPDPDLVDRVIFNVRATAAELF